MALTTFRHNANSITSKYAPACVCASLPQGSESGKSFAPGAFCVMENEIWLPIKGFEGHYEVSNTGRVKSIKKGTDKILALGRNHKGYPQIRLSKPGVKSTFRVHRIVADTFIPNESKLPQVNHKNGVKTDNRVGNLEWSTGDNNIRHAIHTLGYRHGAKLYSVNGGEPITQTEVTELLGHPHSWFRRWYSRGVREFLGMKIIRVNHNTN